jgi:hypothetical protein
VEEAKVNPDYSDRRYLSAGEAARFLGTTVRELHRLVREDKVPMTISGSGQQRFDRAALAGLASNDQDGPNIPERTAVEVLGTAQELIMLREHVWKYRPDIVLLAFFTGNDVRNNFRELNDDPNIPYFVYREDRLTLDDSFRNSLASLEWSPAQRAARGFIAAIRNHSRVLQVLDQARFAFRRREAAKAVDMASAESAAIKGGEAGVDNAVYSEPADENWKEAWRVTEGLISVMANEVRSRGARFWVVTLSTGIQVYPDGPVRQAFMKRLGMNDLFYPDMRVRALCDREDIPVVTLAPAMADYALAHKAFLHGFPNATMGFGHWNEAGNELAGKLIAARLCETVKPRGGAASAHP